MCIITSFLERSQQPVTNNIYSTYTPYPLNTLPTVVVRKKNEKPVFACVNVFRIFVPEQVVTLVSSRPPQLSYKHLLTF